jgi:hypothetical protein
MKKYLLLYNDGNGWNLYNIYPDTKEYWKEVIATIKFNFSNYSFLIVEIVEEFE